MRRVKLKLYPYQYCGHWDHDSSTICDKFCRMLFINNVIFGVFCLVVNFLNWNVYKAIFPIWALGLLGMMIAET